VDLVGPSSVNLGLVCYQADVTLVIEVISTFLEI
jgi:hypothetical protein